MSALEKLLTLSGVGEPVDLDGELLLGAQTAAHSLAVLLASADSDDDGDEDGDSDNDGDGGEHAGHATYKAMIKRNIPPKRAAAMCARSDKRVKATQLARSLDVMLAGQPGADISLVTLATPPSETAAGRRKEAAAGHALPDGSYPIPDVKHLHSAATLAASGHGNVSAAKALIRRRARELGVDVNSLPGFGKGDSEDDEKAAASMISLAAKAGPAMIAMHHGPMTGTHSHAHQLTAAHDHEHQHFGDNNHYGGPLHRPGSEPRRDY